MATMLEELERRRHRRAPAHVAIVGPRDVGWVFHSVAVAVADRAARQTGVRHRVRAGRHGGWVAEPVVVEPCS